MRSARSISWIWYWMVIRSSNSHITFGPTATLRERLCSSACARIAGRSREYCSRVKRSLGLSFCMYFLESVGNSQQFERMRGFLRILHAALDLVAGHRAVAGVVLGLCVLHARDHRAANLHRRSPELLFD